MVKRHFLMHTLIPTENGEFKTYQKLRNLNEPGVPKAFSLNKLKRIQNIRLPPKTVFLSKLEVLLGWSISTGNLFLISPIIRLL